jgi:hypothetical protein
MKTLIEIICMAIDNKLPLILYYESKSSGTKGWREVRPYLLGVNKKGNLELAAVPIEELSKKQIDQRISKHYLLENLDAGEITVIPSPFDDPGVPRSRITTTPTMKEVICRFRYKDEIDGQFSLN